MIYGTVALTLRLSRRYSVPRNFEVERFHVKAQFHSHRDDDDDDCATEMVSAASDSCMRVCVTQYLPPPFHSFVASSISCQLSGPLAS